MSLLSDLFKKHEAKLKKDQKSAIEEELRRAQMLEELISPRARSDIEAQSAFIMFERVFGAEPVNLFGQDVPSIAHTIVRIFQSTESENAILNPAEEIFSARFRKSSYGMYAFFGSR
jgi:hypothetical protein